MTINQAKCRFAGEIKSPTSLIGEFCNITINFCPAKCISEIASSNKDFPGGGLWLYRLRVADPICLLAAQHRHSINYLIGLPSNMLPATTTATRSPCNSMNPARFMWHGIYLYLTHWDLNKMPFCKYFQIYFLRKQLLHATWFKYHRRLFIKGKLVVSQRWFKKWLDSKQATDHYQKQWWPQSLMP